MIKRNLVGILISGLFAPILSAQPAAPAQPNLEGPRISFATPVYDFGKVKAGDPVKYTFFFTNSGDQVLEVKSVQPSCGCTTAGEWTKLVKAGEQGEIPVQFNSANFNGQVFKTISVASNDRKAPTVVLQLKGTVWKPIELVPPYTIMNVPPDAPPTTAVVRIINNLDEAITLSDPQCNNKSFTASIEPTQPGKEFRLSISAVPPLNPGSIQGKVTLKTSITNMPALEVPFWANIQPALMVVPSQLVLPSSPLNSKYSPGVTIQNNTTNALKITDPQVNAPGVELVFKELQPGRVFNATFNFPPGFEIAPGQQVRFTAKTSNPHHPEISVPITQMPRPMPQSAAPANLNRPAGFPPVVPPAQSPHAER